MTAAALPLPGVGEFTAEPAWQAIDFVSDLHLSQETRSTLAAFGRYITSTSADAVFILGDLFDAWVGDDSRHEGVPAECAELLAAAAARRTVAFMVGNRDFLLGTDMLAHCGIVGLTDPTVLTAFGQRLMLCHGDALCLADRPYQAFRQEVRSAAWQQRFLSLPLQQRQELAKQMRAESQRHQALQVTDEQTDIDEPTAAAWMREAGTAVMVHGHTHRPGSVPFASGLMRHVMSDWDLDGNHGHPRAEVLRLTTAGIRRLDWSQGPSRLEDLSIAMMSP
jgi:UDP-2,3-diacylglucosamine hydrolase